MRWEGNTKEMYRSKRKHRYMIKELKLNIKVTVGLYTPFKRKERGLEGLNFK